MVLQKLIIEQFRKSLFPGIVKSIDPQLEFSELSHFSESSIYSSGLIGNNNWSETIIKFLSSNYLHGKVGKLEIGFADFILYTENQKKIKGVFLVSDFNKEFKGYTIIRSEAKFNFAKKLFWSFRKKVSHFITGVIAPDFLKKHPEFVKVDLEDVAFEKEFEVYATDQIEARYILSPALMQNLMALKRKVNRTMEISFVKQKMYLLIYGYAVIPIHLLKPLDNFENIAGIAEHVALLKNIADELRMNNNIFRY